MSSHLCLESLCHGSVILVTRLEEVHLFLCCSWLLLSLSRCCFRCRLGSSLAWTAEQEGIATIVIIVVIVIAVVSEQRSLVRRLSSRRERLRLRRWLRLTISRCRTWLSWLFRGSGSRCWLFGRWLVVLFIIIVAIFVLIRGVHPLGLLWLLLLRGLFHGSGSLVHHV